ncbi:tRNA-dihydrouridine synthase, putative [Stappia aggregata IAM 12614]|uniref:tRNA-dihydrouridine synthase n=1 Tax=Roseibium aggregatum (strain ATCC 25650 / DSM 13394 / JCM 20685 / NBRC 16684 / NCIMB 2208 / IAM 12614 / B1) TaxID=384765 RepID=A0NSU3_ROSAI|nr:tRNA-dihydrouridine synthase, putative [Stappia aggregata IAM 12614] [Roseibium aggregatum IAM 12614]
MKMLTIGRYQLANPAMLAPMSGVTDLPFRRLAARYGAGMVVSEMVASESFVKGDAETQMRAEAQDKGLHVVQLAGREARWMGEAAKVVAGLGADVIDINMGCPAKKVTSGYSGSALMRDLDHALTLIEATVAAVDIPVTLKMRLGWDDKSLNAPELARRAEAAGIKLITVHGRTRCQFYKGNADWRAIAAVKEAISVPLIANGDCKGFENALRMLELSGADGVMIGRGAYGRPWLPGHIGHFLATGEKLEAPRGAELAELVAEHYEAVLSHYGERQGVRIARKHLGWYLDEAVTAGNADIPGPVRKTLMTSNQPSEVIRLANDWLSSSNIRTAA